MNGILLSVAETGKDVITKIVDGEVVSEKLTTAMELSERIGYALQRSLIGMIIVFGVLAIIWLVLSLFKFVFYKDPNKKTETSAPADKEETVSAPAEASTPSPAVPVSAGSDGEIVAAIIAAITAMRNDEGIVDGFRVVSFKRGTNKPWNRK